VIKKEMKETITFRPYVASTICQFILFSCLLSGLVFCWHSFENWIFLAIGVIPLIGVIIVAKPFVLNLVFFDESVACKWIFGESRNAFFIDLDELI